MNKDSVANYTRSGFEGKVKGVLIDSLAIVEEPDANIKAKFSLNPALKNKIRHDIFFTIYWSPHDDMKTGEFFAERNKNKLGFPTVLAHATWGRIQLSCISVYTHC